MFGSKKIPLVQSTECENKNPIWKYFTVLESDKSKAKFNLCSGTYSLGSDKPKLRTTTNIRDHLKRKHLNEFLKFNKSLEDSKVRKEKRSREIDTESLPSSVQNKKQKLSIFQQTIPAFIESTKIWDINDPKSLEMHKDVFEFLVEDMHPWSMVEDRGFLRMYKK